MKTLEYNSRFDWLNRLLNTWPLIVDTDSVRTFAFSIGPWFRWIRRERAGALYANGLFFLRVNWPLGIFVLVRWSGSTSKKSQLHLGLGYKLNGRITITCRVQSDDTAERGVNGPNWGQAKGWDPGPK